MSAIDEKKWEEAMVQVHGLTQIHMQSQDAYLSRCGNRNNDRGVDLLQDFSECLAPDFMVRLKL